MWLGVDKIVHTLQINFSVSKSDLIFLRNKSLHGLDPILFLISNRLINILWYKALTNIFTCLPLKLNDLTTERLTERDIFICSYFGGIRKFLYLVIRCKKFWRESFFQLSQPSQSSQLQYTFFFFSHLLDLTNDLTS